MAIEKHDTTENTLVPVSEKYTLTIKEAASYFNIGTKKMRRLAEDNSKSVMRFAAADGIVQGVVSTNYIPENMIFSSGSSSLFAVYGAV